MESGDKSKFGNYMY